MLLKDLVTKIFKVTIIREKNYEKGQKVKKYSNKCF